MNKDTYVVLAIDYFLQCIESGIDINESMFMLQKWADTYIEHEPTKQTVLEYIQRLRILRQIKAS